MYSELKSIEICVLNKRQYVTGYEFEVCDNIDNQILKTILPPITNKFMRPSQVATLLKNCKDTKKHDDDSIEHRFIWYLYEGEYYYPVLAVNGIFPTHYNIPASVINADSMNKLAQDEWKDYIDSLQSEFYYEHEDTTLDARNYGDYVSSITDKFTTLPQYFRQEFKPVKERVYSWGSEVLEEEEVRKERLEKARLEKEKGTDLVPPPFDYDRKAPRLVIPRRLESINFSLVKHFLTVLQNSYGTNFDANGVRQYRQSRQDRFNVITNLLKEKYGCIFLSFNARKLSDEHYGYQLCKYIGIDHTKYVAQGTSNMSFKKEDLEKLSSEADSMLSEGKINQNQYDVIKLNEEAYNLNTELKLIGEIYEGLSGNSPRCDYVEKENRICFHSGINETETKRFTTNNPNVQGKPASIKSLIVPRASGRKIIAVDIKAQEVVILVFGVLENKELQRLSLEYGDCYRAFAELAGLEYTPEVKTLIKVPILSIMNGKSDYTIRNEMIGHLDVAEKIFDIIYNDPGYRKIDDIARVESKKANAVRRGLFGTEVLIQKAGKYGNDAGSKRRQSLNGNFQLTASEIVTTCLHAMIFDLLSTNNKWELDIKQVTPIVTIYDEVLFDVDDSVLDVAKELISFYMLPTVQGWVEMTGEFTEGDHYVHK